MQMLIPAVPQSAEIITAAAAYGLEQIKLLNISV